MRTRLLLLGYFLLSLTTLEILLEIYYPLEIFWKASDEYFLYSYHSGKSAKIVRMEHQTLIETNELGFRQKGIKNKNFSTIAIGKQVEGIGVKESEIYLNLLNSNKGFRFLAIGNTKFSPILYPLVLEWLIPIYKPKSIILELHNGDFLQNAISESELNLDSSGIPISVKKNLLQKILGTNFYNSFFSFHLSGLVFSKLTGKDIFPYHKITREDTSKNYSRDEAKILSQSLDQEIPQTKDTEKTLVEFSKNQLYTQRAVKIAKENGIKPILLYIPDRSYFVKKEKWKNSKEYQTNLKTIEIYPLWIKSFCKTEKLDCILLSNLWNALDADQSYYYLENNLNKEGHRKIYNLLDHFF